ncbi:MAG: M23 family metallopeptidase [candidate division WOR-3 bacterium]|nr:M23 family metallopeptidase [candidate division WOR-3 bacterium]
MPRKELSFFVASNYSANSLRFSVPLWMARLLGAVACLLALLVVATLVMALAGTYRLSKLSYLERRNRQLEGEFAKVAALRKQLVQVEEQSRKMAAMLGVDKTPAPVNWDSVPLDSQSLPEWLKGKVWGTQMVPRMVPVEGYAVSQRASDQHQAIDLAAPAGAPVRATADAVVEQRGDDRQYGRFLLLQHGQGYESYYGHLQDWNVDKGDTVQAGATIGWVGTTGKSTAPHLHFEIRKDGQRIDPATVLKF